MRLNRVGSLLSSSLVAAVLFAATAAEAQSKAPASSGASRSNSQFTLRRGKPGGAEAEAGRSRARAGDCAGALASFDLAVKTSVDPTIRRDRGLCHEHLGNVFPAIDDYRAYLMDLPDAPDSEQIRTRLAALEEQVKTIDGPPSSSVKDGERSEPSSLATETSIDVVVAREAQSDIVERSPLRKGRGLVLGLFVQMPRFWFGDRASSKLAYAAGGAFRYSLGSAFSLISELGWSGIGPSGELSAQSGALLMGGGEFRLRLSRLAGDHVLVRGGVGFERQTISGTRAVTSTLLGRFGLGYRHVFGSSLALEALADGGPARVMVESGSGRTNFVAGLSVGFVVGF